MRQGTANIRNPPRKDKNSLCEHLFGLFKFSCIFKDELSPTHNSTSSATTLPAAPPAAAPAIAADTTAATSAPAFPPSPRFFHDCKVYILFKKIL